MAIKNLRFSFDVPIVDLLSLIATRNDNLRIDVIGDGKEPKQAKQLRNGAAAIAGLLEGPRRGTGNKHSGRDANGQSISGQQAIAKAVMAAPDHAITMSVLREAMQAHGLNPKSVSPQVSLMRKRGDLKQTGKGAYKVTAQGERNLAKMLKEREDKIGAQS